MINRLLPISVKSRSYALAVSLMISLTVIFTKKVLAAISIRLNRKYLYISLFTVKNLKVINKTIEILD